jgi:hypothetical protein
VFFAHTSESSFLVEPALLFWRFRFGDVFSGKELVGGIIVTDIPKVLRHGNDEGSNNKDGEDRRVLPCIFGTTGRLDESNVIYSSARTDFSRQCVPFLDFVSAEREAEAMHRLVRQAHIKS